MQPMKSALSPRTVMAGLVPAISLRMAPYVPKRDARHKAGHDSIELARCIFGQTLRIDGERSVFALSQGEMRFDYRLFAGGG
jgi:hypothetical protein